MRLLYANLSVVNNMLEKCGGDAFSVNPSQEWMRWKVAAFKE